MIKRKRDNLIIEQYESTRDFLTTLNAREYNTFAETRRTGYEKKFAGVTSFDDAVNLFTSGYSTPVKEFNRAEVSNVGYDMTPKFVNCIAGGAVSVPRALAGVPTCMIKRVEQPQRARVVRLAVDVGRAGRVSKRDIIAWGKKIVALVRSIESAGRRVQIDVFATCTHDFDAERVNAFTLPIKNASQPLDLKRICFPLVHPAFQRVFKFDWYDRLPQDDVECVWGYGHAVCYETQETQNRIVRALFGDNCHYVGFKTDIEALAREL